MVPCECIPNESLMRSVIAYSPGSGRTLIPARPLRLRYRVVTSNKTQRGHIYAVFCLSLSLWPAGRAVTRLAVSELSSVFTLSGQRSCAQYTWPRPAYLATVSPASVCHTLAHLSSQVTRRGADLHAPAGCHTTVYCLSASLRHRRC